MQAYISGIGFFHKLHPKSKFSPEEDIKLTKLVEQFGTDNWNLISNKMKRRNSRQCRDRWENYLSPTLNKEPFTNEEDLLILEKYEEIGAKWVTISKFLVGRTDISVKSRWLMLQRRNITIETIKQNMHNQNNVQEEKDVNSLTDISSPQENPINRIFEVVELEDNAFWDNVIAESSIPSG